MSDSVHINKLCILIPAYHEEKQIGSLVRDVLTYVPHVLVIDDGSRDRTAQEAERAGAVVLRHAVNRGKGAALLTGIRHAENSSFMWLITMDGDGQHHPREIPVFIKKYAETGLPALIGNRMQACETMPLIRVWTNRCMSRLISRIVQQPIPDTQCGYRMYHRDLFPLLHVAAGRFETESEQLLHLGRSGIAMGSVPVSTVYRDEKSKIKPLRDTFRFARMIYRFYRMS